MVKNLQRLLLINWISKTLVGMSGLADIDLRKKRLGILRASRLKKNHILIRAKQAHGPVVRTNLLQFPVRFHHRVRASCTVMEIVKPFAFMKVHLSNP